MKNIFTLLVLTFTVMSAYAQPPWISSIDGPGVTGCGGGCDGYLSINAGSYNSPETYSIDGGSTFQSSNSFSNLCPGSFLIVVMDAGGQQTSMNYDILNGGGPNLSLINIQDPLCSGSSDGLIDLSIVGGNSPFTITGGDSPSTPDITNATAGNYMVTVSDANGCADTVYNNLYDPDPVLMGFNETPTTCYGLSDGGAQVFPYGGNNTFTYLWETGATVDNISNVVSNMYTVTVTDGNGCVGIDSIQITQPDSIIIGLAGLQDVSCNGYNDGSISLNVNGGDFNYNFYWSNGNLPQDLLNAGPGTYTVTATDGNGCSSAPFTQTINEPAAIAGTIIEVTSISCNWYNDGVLAINATGGTPPYSYYWASSTSTIDTAYNVYAGYNEVDITDANGCMYNTGITLTEPSSISISFSATDIICAGICDGTLTAVVTGGTAPYTYLWDDPNTQTTLTATGLCETAVSGLVYTMSVTDANGCTNANSPDPSVNGIAEPDSLDISISSVNATCSNANGSAVAIVTGGITPYTLSWSNGGTGLSETNLVTNDYAFDVVDANGCTLSDTAYIGIDVIPVDVCVVTVDTTSTKNVIVWTKPIATGIKEFKVYRDIVGTYTYVASVPYDSLSEFVDNTTGVNPAVTQYRYKISVLDSCGNESTLSDYHQTIHLNAPAFSGNTADLVWQGYSGFVNNYYYRILRDTTLTNNWQAIDSVSSTTLVYTDIAVPSSANIRYFVEIAFPGTCTASKAIDHNTTRSNRATVTNGNPNSIAEITKENFTMLPNPSNGIFTIRFDNSKEVEREVIITDVQGKIVEQFVSQIGSKFVTIDLSRFESGLYMVKVASDANQYSVKRLIKQ